MYRRLFLPVLFFFSFISISVNAQDNDPYLSLIPAPVTAQKLSVDFILNQQTVLVADSVTNKSVVFLADYLQKKALLNIKPQAYTGQVVNNGIIITSAGADALPAEGYRLLITPQNVTIVGKGAGIFYGVQTLLQLFPLDHSAAIRLPGAEIEDYPRFKYRGLHLDVSRHFFSVEFVKKYIDLMVTYKLNNFHWHLTDDQGWRIEIKKYPKLTSVGSVRPETLIGNYHDRTPQQFDNTPYGGYYTQDEAREVIKYAAERYVNVIPEIDLPGHSKAALTAYPEYGCNIPSSYNVSGTWSERHDVFCPSEATFSFLNDVLTEIIDIFPSKYIHIGGDEVAKDDWKNSKLAQEVMRKNRLKDEQELQSYFVKRLEVMVNSKGRTAIGWDEVLQGGIAPNVTIMSWTGETGGIAAARQSHDVIMTPSTMGLYLDHAQGKLGNEPVGIGNYKPLSLIYSYNPVPAVLTPEQQKYIIGVQANLWAEYIATEKKVEYMVLPRMLALSEIAWTPLANKNYQNFTEVRMPKHLARLDKNGFNYRVPEVIGAKDTIIFGTQLNVNLKAPVSTATVYYTIDGYNPRETDLEYTKPMTYNVPPDQFRELKTIAITPTGKRGDIVRTVVYNKQPFPPISYSGTATGLKYQLLSGTFNSTTQLNTSPQLDTLIAKSFNVQPFRTGNKPFGIVYNGYINIEADGVYGFSTLSDDGSVILIDDQIVVDNDGKHALFEKGGAVPLLKGFHKFTLKYFNVGITGSLRVFMTLPGKPKGELSADSMYN